jgi:hypothetical protein
MIKQGKLLQYCHLAQFFLKTHKVGVITLLDVPVSVKGSYIIIFSLVLRLNDAKAKIL